MSSPVANIPVVIVIPQSKVSFEGQPIGTDSVQVKLYYVVPDAGGTAITPANWIEVDAKMHVRGDATQNLSKKQYSVHLASDPPDGNTFLHMPAPSSGKHWIFNDCGAVDFSMIRNPLAFHLQTTMGASFPTPAWAPRNRYFEMYLCDYGTDPTDWNAVSAFYWGVYLNFEQIRVQKSRINIPNYSKKKPDVDNGMIIQVNPGSDNYKSLKGPGVNTSPGVPADNINIYRPKASAFTGDSDPALLGMQNWYNTSNSTGWVMNMQNVFFNRTTSSTWKDIEDSTDFQSFALYWLLNELIKDPDCYAKSTFMFKKGAKMYGGPFWDKNKSFGNIATLGSGSWWVGTSGWCDSQKALDVWMPALLKSKDFCGVIWNLWTENSKTGGILTADTLNTFIDNQVNYLSSHMSSSDSSTSVLDATNEKWAGGRSYTTQIDQLKSYLKGRLAWFVDNDNLANYLKGTSGFTPS